MNYMKNSVYIYGAGKRGKALPDVIHSCYSEMISVSGFIDMDKNEGLDYI